MVVKRFLLLSLVLALASVGSAQPDPVSKIKQDLAGWGVVMEMFIVDDGHYPEVSSIEALAQEVYTRQYAEQIVVSDPSGRPYRATLSRNHYRISSADGSAFIENGFKVPVVKEPPTPSTSPASFSFPSPRSPDTTLYVTKSGNDIRLDWSGTGTQYDGAMGSDPRFSYPRILFMDSTASSYLYKDGLLKYNETFLCYDVTDEVEVNHAGYWNGGVMPPPPPTIDTASPTNIGSLYDGSTGTIVGTGFSTNPAENFICFDGGVCTPATTATATQVQFTTPPGAVSGDITVQVGPRVSNPATGFVTLEDPALGWNIRTIGYSEQAAEYWMAGNGPAGQSIYRVYYDPGTKKWLKSDQKGGMSAQSIVCSGHTSRAGRLFCGYWTTSTSGGTRYVDTSPVGTLTGCTGLPGSGSTINIRGVAVDPNPDSVAGRDAAYYAHADVGNNTFAIRRLSATACYSPPPTNDPLYDSNYGNYNWSPNWGAIVGLAVDPVNGDLYVGTLTNISKIDTSQNITAVKGGFTNIYGIDFIRQGPDDPGFLLIADAGTAGAGSVKAIAIDNTANPPLSVLNVTNMRTVNWGGLVFNQIQPGPANALRRVLIHNNNNSGPVLPVRPNPFIGVSPSTSSDLWISAPPPEGGPGTVSGPAAQAYTKASLASDTTYSRGRIVMWYKDDKARKTTAYISDPGKAATGYEPDPANPALCDMPREWPGITGICDNKEDFTTNGVGAFYETGGPLHSTKTCGSFANRCYWENNISRRYGGTNHKVLFMTNDYAGSGFFAEATPIFTHVKHFHFENDRMCRRGGILAQDFNGAACVPWVAGDPLCEAVPDPANLKCNELRVFDWVNLQAEDELKLFDSSVPYETTAQTAIYNSSINRGDGTSIICLKNAGGNGVNLQGTFAASASGPGNNRVIDFSVGKSAGVCLNSTDPANYYIADPSDLRQAYDEAFVNIHFSAYGSEGAGVVPYLPQAWFDAAPFVSMAYFSNIWFAHFIEDLPGPPKTSKAHNYLHLIGATKTTRFDGYSDGLYDFMYIMIKGLEDACAGAAPICIREVTAHEFGHPLSTNACTDLPRCDPPPVENRGSHDYRGWWFFGGTGCPSATPCIMEPTITQPTDGITRFCIEDLLLGDPNCPGVPGSRDGAIRTAQDPQ